MNPEELAALRAEEARVGRPLTQAEVDAVRARMGDGITATPLETSAARTAREARASAAERDRVMADRSRGTGIGEWIADLPETVRSSGLPAAEPIADWLGSSNEASRSAAGSVARGAREGATLGFGDELLAAGETAVSDPALLGRAAFGGETADLQALRERYRAARDRRRMEDEASREANPGLYFAGSLVGGAAVPVPGLGGATGGITRTTGAIVPRIAAGTGRAIRAGAAGGAIAGAGMSDAEVAEDAAGLLRDTAEGAGVGAGAGAVIGGGAEVARGIARARPAVRTGADWAAMGVPGGTPSSGRRLNAEMGGDLAENAQVVRDFMRPLGWAPSVEEIAGRADDLMEGGSGPSAAFEERMEGMAIDREELAAILRRRAAAGERSPIEATEMAPLRAGAARLSPPRPRRGAAPGAEAPPPAAPPAPAGGPPRPGTREMLGRAPTEPAVRAPGPGDTGPLRGSRPGTGPLIAHPEPFRSGTSRGLPDPTSRDLAPPEMLPSPAEGTVPPVGFGEDPADFLAVRNRIRAHLAGEDVAAGRMAEEPGTGAGRPVARRGRAAAPPAPPPPAPPPRGPLPSGPRPPSGDTTMVGSPPGPPPRGRTVVGGGADLRGEPPVRPPIGEARPLEAPPPRPEPVSVSRPRAERPLGARPYEGPGPGSVPSGAGGSMPIFTRPERGSRLRSEPGSVLYEMRAARRRGIAPPLARPSAGEHGWMAAGGDIRDRLDSAFRARFGPEELSRYRAARRVEEVAIPIGREAAAAAASRGGAVAGGLRDAAVSSAVGSAAGGGFLPMMAGLGAARLSRNRGSAARAGLLDAVARGLETRPARDFAAGDGSTVRALSGYAGRVGAGAREAASAPSELDRSRLERFRRPEPAEAEPAPIDAPLADPAPASSPVPPPAGGATTTTRTRRVPSEDARRRLERYRRTD